MPFTEPIYSLWVVWSFPANYEGQSLLGYSLVGWSRRQFKAKSVEILFCIDCAFQTQAIAQKNQMVAPALPLVKSLDVVQKRNKLLKLKIQQKIHVRAQPQASSFLRIAAMRLS